MFAAGELFEAAALGAGKAGVGGVVGVVFVIVVLRRRGDGGFGDGDAGFGCGDGRRRRGRFGLIGRGHRLGRQECLPHLFGFDDFEAGAFGFVAAVGVDVDFKTAPGVEENVASVEANGGEEREVGEEDDGRFGQAGGERGGSGQDVELQHRSGGVEQAGGEEGEAGQSRGPDFEGEAEAERSEDERVNGDPSERRAGGKRSGDDAECSSSTGTTGWYALSSLECRRD